MPYFGASPSSELANLDINGQKLILDADADTSITSDTDDQIDVEISGADDFRFTANTFTALSGSTIAIASGATIANSGTATGFVGTKLEASSDTSAGDNAAIGYTSAEGLILTGQGSTDDITVKNDADTTVLNVATGGTDVEVSAGNIVMGTASKGIYLGVTSATAANLLDDYEEGTFTATWTGGGAPTTPPTVSSDYTKIGRLVYLRIKFPNSNTSGASSGHSITGIPFAPSPDGQAAGSLMMHTGADFNSNESNLTIYVTSSGLEFYVTEENTAWTSLAHSAGTNRQVWLSVQYMA